MYIYTSPINVTFREMESKLNEEIDNAIVLDINQKYGIEIDKEALLKALQYDRHQYLLGRTEGIKDGKSTSKNCLRMIKSDIQTLDPKEYTKEKLLKEVIKLIDDGWRSYFDEELEDKEVM